MKTRIVAILLALALALTLVACGGEAAPEAEGGEAAGAQTVTGTAAGLFGDVTVTLTVEDGKVTDAVIEGKDETPEYGGEAMKAMSAAMIESGSVEVDVYAGATMTSNAVLEAAKAAMAQVQ